MKRWAMALVLAGIFGGTAAAVAGQAAPPQPSLKVSTAATARGPTHAI
jgi:hypothetical protein